VIARRAGHNAPRLFFGREQPDLIHRAAYLKRAGRLPVFQLEPDIGAGLGAQVGATHQRRGLDKGRDAALRL